MKRCCTCKIEKPLEMFSKNKMHVDGLQDICKSCHSAYYKEWKLKNKTKVNEYNKQWSANQKANNTESHKKRVEYVKQYNAKYYEDNKEYYEQYTKVHNLQKKYRENNKGRYSAWAAKRRASKMQQTPTWIGIGDTFEMECIYTYANALNSIGLQYHVDHITPLQGKIVSGLHIPENLQVITAEANMRKGNRYDQT